MSRIVVKYAWNVATKLTKFGTRGNDLTGKGRRRSIEREQQIERVADNEQTRNSIQQELNNIVQTRIM